MSRLGIALELFFGIGFRIGFLIAVIGTFLMFLPVMMSRLNPILEYAGVWEAVQTNPDAANMLMTGLFFMVIAVIMYMVKGWFDPAWDILFGRDEPLKVK